jgi:hypothetical protein
MRRKKFLCKFYAVSKKFHRFKQNKKYIYKKIQFTFQQTEEKWNERNLSAENVLRGFIVR